ncbi:MAG: hypothetical protein FWB80_00225 [Defluviitaleaceae bacterium]|nr:hypothetical protein [Defluviitaleaceae bacterium]
MANDVAGRLRYAGDWTPGMPVEENDVVTHANQLFRAKIVSSGNTAPDAGSSIALSRWEQIGTQPLQVIHNTIELGETDTASSQTISLPPGNNFSFNVIHRSFGGVGMWNQRVITFDVNALDGYPGTLQPVQVAELNRAERENGYSRSLSVTGLVSRQVRIDIGAPTTADLMTTDSIIYSLIRQL